MERYPKKRERMSVSSYAHSWKRYYVRRKYLDPWDGFVAVLWWTGDGEHGKSGVGGYRVSGTTRPTFLKRTGSTRPGARKGSLRVVGILYENRRLVPPKKPIQSIFMWGIKTSPLTIMEH
jgi:hypothetical protein